MIPETLDFGFNTNANQIFGNYIGFLVLEAFSEKTDQEIRNLLTDERLEKHPSAFHMIESFLSEEIIECNIESYTLKDFPLFNDGFENCGKHKEELKRMLVQHNVRIISKYYSRVTLSRISTLNNVDKDYCE